MSLRKATTIFPRVVSMMSAFSASVPAGSVLVSLDEDNVKPFSVRLFSVVHLRPVVLRRANAAGANE
jgi:hypothetical protein